MASQLVRTVPRTSNQVTFLHTASSNVPWPRGTNAPTVVYAVFDNTLVNLVTSILHDSPRAIRVVVHNSAFLHFVHTVTILQYLKYVLYKTIPVPFYSMYSMSFIKLYPCIM